MVDDALSRPDHSTGDGPAGAGQRTTGAPAGNKLRRMILRHMGTGPYAPLSRAEVLEHVPAGSLRAKSQSDYLRSCSAILAAERPRADYAEHLMEYARTLARYASWSDRTTRPTRARVCAEAGMSPSTFKSCRAWWEARGCQATVRRGYTPHLRPGAVDQDEPNEAAVYVLCVPIPARAKAQTRTKLCGRPGADTPSPLSRPLTGNPPGTHSTRESATGETQLGPAQERRTHCRRMVAVLRQGPGQTISDARSAWLARIFQRAGWTPADVAIAIAHHPADGRYRSSVSDVTRPGAWLFWRLSRWLNEPDAAWRHYCATGQLGPYRPAPSPSQRSLAIAARDRARAAELAAERDAAAAAATPPTDTWRAARAQLAARHPTPRERQ